MKKRIARVLCLVLAMTTLMATGAMAANTEPASGPAVRVNGEIVTFPDGQPYVDENSRTMIPVRFVTEELGADVEWDGKTRTASISKNGATVDITIGSSELKVTKDGKTETVTMDTAAVLKDGRTYVPIRFVAEALGATVDYCNTYKVVGIYDDVLTAEQIAKLQAYDYTQPDNAISYETAKARHDAETLAFYYGTDRESFGVYANAREHLYHTLERNGTYYFEKTAKVMNGGDNDTFYQNVVDEAVAEVSYQSERLTIKLYADTSCIYQADAIDALTTAVRGIAEVDLKVKATELTGEEVARLCDLGFTKLQQGVTLYSNVDIHMNTQPGYKVNIHTIVPLDDAN